MRVVVDVGERNSTLWKLLFEDPAVALEMKSLPVGDYIVEDRFLVERKSVTDFTNSLADGRLWRQAWRMRAARGQYVPLLIVEHSESRASGLSVSSRLGAELTLALSYGVPTIHVPSAEAFLWLLRRMGERIGAKDSRLRLRSKPRAKHRHPGAQVVAQLPGVGMKRASALLAHFGSLARLFAADAAQVKAVPGIGAVGATRLARLFQLELEDETE